MIKFILVNLFFCINFWAQFFLIEGKLPSKCPQPSDLQSPFVKKYFDTKKMEGFWYEIAMKDATQPRFCKCQTSNKTLHADLEILQDDFRIECKGAIYLNKLSFNLTETPGILIGTWNKIPFLDKVKFPDTVVDVSVNKNDGSYEWLIEFQCVDGPADEILFYAFNFYNRKYNDTSVIKIMEESARKYGLAPFIDTGKPLAIIDHEGCLPPH